MPIAKIGQRVKREIVEGLVSTRFGKFTRASVDWYLWGDPLPVGRWLVAGGWYL